mmetsp:Transcript_4304/g.11135  ORF Transcript_4304/g.11135 Transcript_4304/m.11135 type:complete len:415 (+) Transcript_4304:375-1619(+)
MFGAQPGYASGWSTDPPAALTIIFMEARTSSRLSSMLLLVEQPMETSDSLSPILTMATLLLVSTSSGMSAENFTGPSGKPSAMVMSATRLSSVRHCVEEVSTPLAVTSSDKFGSTDENSDLNSAVTSPIACLSTCSSSSDVTANMATHSRGMALRLSPPSIDTRRTAVFCDARRSARIISRFALARYSWMLTPLCPPRNPVTAISTARAFAGTAVLLTGSFALVSPPPAHPTKRQPQSSVSRLSMVFAVSFSALASSAKAPCSPTSSATVKSASMGGRFAVSGASRSASAAATPIPLSDPSVVACCERSHSPLTSSRIPCVLKSKSRSEFFSVTMSTCPCMSTGGACAPFPDPGLNMHKFPVSSHVLFSDRASAKFSRYAKMSFSWNEGRGMAAICAKCVQTGHEGSSPITLRL